MPVFVLWIALVVNAVMFGVEIAGGLAANSVSLLVDAVDFLGDAANYYWTSILDTWRAASKTLSGWEKS